ncbi:unnamed protein product, partial [Prorocentrum cordatum]
GGYGHSSYPRADLPVTLGGYRDHRPLESRIFAGVKAKTVKDAGRHRWRRGLVFAELLKAQQAEADPDNQVQLPNRLLNFRAKVQEGIGAKGFQEEWSDICGNGRRYESPTEYFNELEGVVIEKALQDYISPPATRRADGPVFSDQTVRLIKAKHYWQYQLAAIPDGARWMRAQFQLHFNEAAKLATAAIRSEKRQRTAALADEAERAAGQRNLRRLHTIVNKLAPKPAAPIMTVKDPNTGLPCFDAEDDQRVCILSTCDVCDGTAMRLDERPLRAGRKERDDDRIGSYGLAEVKESIIDLPNMKGGPMLQWPMRGAPGGAVAESWKLAIDTLAPPLLQVVNAAQALGDAPQRFKDGETMQLRKPKGDGCTASTDYRTINLINHFGKAYARVTTLDAMREVAHKISPTQFGAMPGRGTRDAAAVAGEVIVRHQREHRAKRRGSTSAPPPMLLAVLTDIEKAFDADAVVRQVHYDPTLKRIRCNDSLKEDECEALDLSQLKFLDDLLTFAETRECDDASITLEVLTGEIKAGGMRVNGRKTEIMLTPSGIGSKKKVTNRIKAANSTHARLLRRAFKSGFSAKLKTRLWKALVRSVCLYCLEVAHLTMRELNKLESWQVKKLRGLLHSPAHLHKTTNREIRKRARTPTVTSTLLLRRLRWWRQVLWLAFREPSDDLHDPTLAIRAVIFGRFSFERVGHGGQSGTLILLLGDMRQMWQTADVQEKLTARRLFQLRGDLHELAEPRLRWLPALEPRSLHRVLTYGGEADAVTDAAAILRLGLKPDLQSFQRSRPPLSSSPQLLPAMFQPNSEVQALTGSSANMRTAVEAGAGGEGKDDQPDAVGIPGTAPGRLALLHEDMARAAHHGNFVFPPKPSQKMAITLDQALAHCVDEGAKAKEKVKEEEVFLGNLIGKRPDAQALAVLFRVAEAVEGMKEAAPAAATQGIEPIGTKAALDELLRYGATAQDQQLKFAATRSQLAKEAESLAFKGDKGAQANKSKKPKKM